MFDFYFAHFGPEALTIAVGTAYVNVRQELHFDVFKARAAAGWATTIAAVEAKGPRGVATLARNRSLRKQLANRIEGAYITRGVRARSFSNLSLIDHHDFSELLRAKYAIKGARRFGGFAHDFEQTWVEHVLDERRLAGPGDTCHTNQSSQWNFNRHIFKIIGGDPFEQ